MATAQRGRVDIQRVQNVLLIWLDGTIDQSSKDCKNTLTHLRHVINSITTFTDEETCVKFINEDAQEKVSIIISGALGQHVVPRIHDMSQVDTIFIFCGNKSRHEGWAKDWPKIQGVFTDIKPICQALKQAVKACELNTLSFSVVKTSGDSKKLNQLDPLFMYTQLIKEIILTIKFQQQHIDQYLAHCRQAFADNHDELNNINQLAEDYESKDAIWWYTKQCFLYPMLNRALRLTEVDIIVKMAFFISDLQRHIERLHQEQFAGQSNSKSFTVFRGLSIAEEDFKKIEETKGGLLAFNTFLSTSKQRSISLGFVLDSLAKNRASVGILFIMDIKPTKTTTPFASIEAVTAIPGEDEVLFSMHAVFRITEITLAKEHKRLYQVHLALTSDDDKDLRVLTDRIREDTYPTLPGWLQLGSVLLRMGHVTKSMEVFEGLLDQTGESEEDFSVYAVLAGTKFGSGEYKEALALYEKALAIQLNTLPPDHRILASIYDCIGLISNCIGDYQKALSSHEKGLEIQKQSLPPNHSDLAAPYNNIGTVYFSMGDSPKALSSHEKALEIQKQSLPLNHPDLAASYMNIGNVYFRMGDCSPKALSSYEKALEIQEQSLPPSHPDLGMTYMNIGNVYVSMGDYPKALSYNENALENRKQSLPPNHPHLAMSYNNIGVAYEKMGDYSEARRYYKLAVDIVEKSLPPSHPQRQTYGRNLERLNNSKGLWV